MMINFFLNFFDLLRSNYRIFYSLSSLIVTLPWLLGYLFSAFHAKGRNKPLWLTLWILMAVVALILAGFEVFISFLSGLRPGESNETKGCVLAIVFLVVYLLCYWLGRIFIPSKKNHWLLIIILFLGVDLGIRYSLWLHKAEPYGEINESALTQQTLEDCAGFDYEIAITSKVDGSCGARLLRIRVKGDSAYYQVIHDEGRFALYVCAHCWMNKIDEMRGVNDSNLWILLDTHKTSSVKKLKKRMASYEQEKALMLTGNEYCKAFMLDDFQEGYRKTLVFCNTEKVHVYDAFSIGKLADGLWPTDATNENQRFDGKRICNDDD